MPVSLQLSILPAESSRRVSTWLWLIWPDGRWLTLMEVKVDGHGAIFAGRCLSDGITLGQRMLSGKRVVVLILTPYSHLMEPAEHSLN
jgi:hypothetical protein